MLASGKKASRYGLVEIWESFQRHIDATDRYYSHRHLKGHKFKALFDVYGIFVQSEQLKSQGLMLCVEQDDFVRNFKERKR